MKKTILLFSLVGLTTISCAKKYNWNCQCVLNGTTTTDHTISDAKESDAQKSCDTQRQVYLASVGINTADCTLIQE